MIDVAWAQAGGASGPPGLVSFVLPILLIFAVFYFLLIRPQQQREREHRQMLANLKKNDKVITSGGLHGRVTELGDDVVTLEIAPNVRVRISRTHIATVLTAPKGEEKGRARENERTSEGSKT